MNCLIPVEKTQVFRIEEKFPSPAHSTVMTTPKQTIKQTANSSVTTQTSPRNDMLPASTPPLFATVASPDDNIQYVAVPQQPQAMIVPAYAQRQSPIPLIVPQVKSLEVK